VTENDSKDENSVCEEGNCVNGSQTLYGSPVCNQSDYTSDKRGGKWVCLSVCLLARLLKNACMNLDEMLRVDRCQDTDELINF